MRFSHFSKLITIAAISGAASISIANPATAIVLNFEGLNDSERVQNFYNGGAGGDGTVGTNNFGASFTGSNNSGGTAQIEGQAGPNFSNAPSPNTVMFMVGNSNNFLNVANGFTTNLSFSYGSRSNQPSIISIYDGLNGTGTLLFTTNLAENNSGPGTPTRISHK